MHLVLFAMYRKDGLSHEDFVAHYRDVHIPITRAFPACATTTSSRRRREGPDAFA